MADEPDIKRLPIKEFRERGYLHEVNRLLLHPLGLALEVSVAAEPTRIVRLSERQVDFLSAIVREYLSTRGADIASGIVDALARGERLEPGDERLSSVWDCQEDPEGVTYDEDLLSPEKAAGVCSELLARRDERKKRTGGWVVQPCPDHQVLSTTYTDPELRISSREPTAVVEPGKFAGVEFPDDET